MNNEIAKLLAERHFKIDDINDWAIKCLEKGYDSKSLRILASMSKWDSDSELGNYYERSLKELGWNQIEEDYLMSYARMIAGEIIEEKTDPIKAARKIYQILVDLDYPAELQAWHKIDEIIWDFEHFVKTGEKYYFYHPKEKLVDEIKRVSEELIKSQEKV